VTLCVALDIGATKLEAALIGRNGDIWRSEGSRTPAGDDPELLFVEVAKLVDQVLTDGRAAPVALGVGSAGPLHDHSEVSPLNIPAWRGFPLRRRLQDRFGLATFLEVDTKALALAEGWRGAAQGSQNYLAMVVSSGIGGGLVLDGRLIEGRTGNAGHVGHVIVEPGGRPCSCGGRGCLEAEASGWAIAAITGKSSSALAGWWVRPSPQWPTYATLTWWWSQVPWLSGTEVLSFRRLTKHCKRALCSRMPRKPV
jgi:glucokinase